MNIDDWKGSDISEQVFEQATHWLVTLDALDNLHDEEGAAVKRAFFEWLEADSAHSSAFAQMSDIWARSACLQGMEHLLDDTTIIQFPLNGNFLEGESHNGISQVPIFNDSTASASAPSWMYYLAIGLIGFSFVLVAAM